MLNISQTFQRESKTDMAFIFPYPKILESSGIYFSDIETSFNDGKETYSLVLYGLSYVDTTYIETIKTSNPTLTYYGIDISIKDVVTDADISDTTTGVDDKLMYKQDVVFSCVATGEREEFIFSTLYYTAWVAIALTISYNWEEVPIITDGLNTGENCVDEVDTDEVGPYENVENGEKSKDTSIDITCSYYEEDGSVGEEGEIYTDSGSIGDIVYDYEEDTVTMRIPISRNMVAPIIGMRGATIQSIIYDCSNIPTISDNDWDGHISINIENANKNSSEVPYITVVVSGNETLCGLSEALAMSAVYACIAAALRMQIKIH